MNVFVYGTLKQGGALHGHMIASKFLGEATTPPKYGLINTGWFPGLVEGNHPVSGELYKVDETTLAHLDAVEGVPHLFSRDVITVIDQDNQEVETYTYKINNRQGYSGILPNREGKVVFPV